MTVLLTAALPLPLPLPFLLFFLPLPTAHRPPNPIPTPKNTRTVLLPTYPCPACHWRLSFSLRVDGHAEGAVAGLVCVPGP
jgi:hypothetical protein